MSITPKPTVERLIGVGWAILVQKEISAFKAHRNIDPNVVLLPRAIYPSGFGRVRFAGVHVGWHEETDGIFVGYLPELDV